MEFPLIEPAVPPTIRPTLKRKRFLSLTMKFMQSDGWWYILHVDIFENVLRTFHHLRV